MVSFDGAASVKKTGQTVDTNTHRYSNHTPLPVLPVVHDTWATKLMYPEAYVCAWTPSNAPIACY